MRNSWIFVGHLLPGQTSLMRMNALRRCDVDVTGFDTRSIWNTQTWLQRQMSTRLERGPAIDGINKGLIDVARDVRPTHIWFDKQEFIRPDTLDELKRLGACLVYYTPDPYFTLVWKRTRLMDACLTRFGTNAATLRPSDHLISTCHWVIATKCIAPFGLTHVRGHLLDSLVAGNRDVNRFWKQSQLKALP